MSNVYTRPRGLWEARLDDSFLERTGRWIMRRLLWAIPAFVDLFSDDLGPDYDRGLALIICLLIGALFPIMFLCYLGYIDISIAMPAEVGVYLCFEILYRLHQRHWNM